MQRQKTILLTALLAVASLTSTSQSQPPNPTAVRNYYLSELLKPHDYSVEKNSFLIQKLSRGQRRTILNVSGSGSVRHIWSTWSIPGDESAMAPAGKILTRIFLDHESTPSISGTFDDLCRAAEATGTSFAPLPAFNYKGAFNFYLPIFFNKGIRIEIEALDAVEEFYAQIDYRIEASDHRQAKLVSQVTSVGLVLKYVGQGIPNFNEGVKRPVSNTQAASRDLQYGSDRQGSELTIGGPGILRKLTFRGDQLPDLQLEIYWDDEPSPSVKAPLRYFFADFTNAAMESKPGEMICYFPMPFGSKARIVVRNLSRVSGHVEVGYELEATALPAKVSHFHAEYRDALRTTGHSQYSVLQARGEGLFVGVNLFDTGHNHGGGDAALIDAGTAAPHVLHGICGEDYFGFAWHNTGTMTYLTGAPEHARRFRLHLENPYPFHESLQFLFGVFAGQEPKSVAFWYQVRDGTRQDEWQAVDVPWKILGPLGPRTPLPDGLSDGRYETTVSIKDPITLRERWQDAVMTSGFIDFTYQFRHYAMIERGTGFVPGSSRTKLTTYIHSPSRRVLDVILGHDDEVVVELNGKMLVDLPGRTGFGPSGCHLSLLPGWNALSLVVSNEENVNWRWSGISLATRRSQSQGVRFSSQPEGLPQAEP